MPFPDFINYASGVIEAILGLAFQTKDAEWIALWVYSDVLFLFIPSYVHFIQIGFFVEVDFCLPPWLARVRLLIIDLLLVL